MRAVLPAWFRRILYEYVAIVKRTDRLLFVLHSSIKGELVKQTLYQALLGTRSQKAYLSATFMTSSAWMDIVVGFRKESFRALFPSDSN